MTKETEDHLFNLLETGDRVLVNNEWFTVSKSCNKNTVNSKIVCVRSERYSDVYFYYCTWRIKDIEGEKGKVLRSLLALEKLSE
jgi:hypothetical protein